MRSGRHALAAASAVLLTLVLLEAVGGAPVGDVLLYLLGEVWFALVPGVAVCAALGAAAGPPAWMPAAPRLLTPLALGYAVGLVLEVLAFALSASLHARGLLWAYPPATVLLCAAPLRRHGLRAVAGPPSAGAAPWRWGLAGVCIAAMALTAAAYFPIDPLPSSAGSVQYIPDLVFHLSVAAEALHHWPITDPKVSGTALPYELFLYMKLAASAQVTHISLPVILFRLYVLPLVLEIALLLYCTGVAISSRPSVGIVAAALFLLVGQLGLDPRDPLVFYNTVFFSLYDSPTYTFGLVIFLAALAVLCLVLFARRPARGAWALLILLLVGCSGAKASILPDLLGGLAILLAGLLAARHIRRLAVDPRLTARVIAVAALTALVFAATYAIIYHGGTGGLEVDPPGSVRAMGFIRFLEARAGSSIPRAPFWIAAAIIGLVGFCGATLAGLPAALARRSLRREPVTWFLLAVLMASLIPFLTFTHKGGSQNFFAYYGVCAASLVSARGLVAAVARARPHAARAVALAVAWIAGLAVAATVPYAVAASPGQGSLFALWVGLPAFAVCALLLAAWRLPARRAALTAAAAGALTLTGALDTPLHVGNAVLAPLVHGRSLYVHDGPRTQGLDRDLQQALAWVRRHVPVNAVIAVNNQFSDRARTSPDYYYYSAFGERRIFLEGWEDTIAAASLSNFSRNPFPARLALNDRVFIGGDLGALATIERRYGVGYLLIDTVHGPVPPSPRALGRVIFRNGSVIILKPRKVSRER